MNRNRIVIGPPGNPLFDFNNDQLKQVDVVLRSSFSGDELAYDQLNAATFAGEAWDLVSSEGDDLYSSENYQLVSSPADLSNEIPAGTAVRYYVGDELIGKFYAQPTTRENRLVYDVNAISAVGLLAKRQHKGGLYNGETFANVAADIINGAFTFSCSPDVSSLQIRGWLPYTKDARENLHQLMFAYGVMVYKDSAGDVYFDFAQTTFEKTISPDKTYINGDVTPVEPFPMVRVTEHQYYALQDDIEYTLFDNVSGLTADNLLVLFDHAPIHDLTATGNLSIIENGVNYAIISGNGSLTGKAYTHTQEVYEQGTPGGNTLEITEQTLINELNSISVAQRLLNYYGVTENISTDIQVTDEKPGQLVEITNPYKEQTRAYLREMTITGLATAKARCELLANFTPTKGGNNYNDYALFTTSGTWTVPAGVTMVRAQIAGGGQAGHNGANGSNGTTGSPNETNPAKGGKGGEKGEGGSAGKVAVYNIAVTPGSTITVSIGAGGQADGALGAASTITVNGTTYSSADGTVPLNGVTNQFTGDVYALPGPEGKNGANGGDQNNNGGDVETWLGGTAGQRTTRTQSYGSATGNGGGGGGAAEGEAGANGDDGSYYLGVNGNDRYIYGIGGDGGDGGDASAPSYTAPPASGGHGGHGGGGGGGGGTGSAAQGPNPPSSIPRNYGIYGAGGLGSAGTPGGNGFVNFLY